jgi:hypothetical protein
MLGKTSTFHKDLLQVVQSQRIFDNALSLTVPGFGYTALEKTLDDIAVKYLQAREKSFRPAYLDFDGQDYS